jgi:hypothetical protein
MNPLTYIPEQVRFVMYLAYGVGFPIVMYLKARGIIGQDEIDLFTAIGAFLGATAASNMSSTKPATPINEGENL